MRGNCDSKVDMSCSDFPICDDLSMICVDGINIYLNHGDLYSYDNRDKFYDKGVLVYGHYHIPYIRKDKDMVYICVGSISLPRGGSDYSYMIYENHKFTLYNIDGVELNFIDV